MPFATEISEIDSSISRFVFRPTSGTSLSGLDDASNTLVYRVGAVTVSRNGIEQDVTDYVATDGLTMTGFSPAFTAGEVVQITADKARVLGDTYSKTETDSKYLTPTGDGSNLTGIAADPSAISGVIETDGTYVATTQPFVMPDGSGTYIATVKDAGADGTVELWKIDVSGVVGGSATASVTLTGAATVTSIAQSMGYIIVGSEDGMHIIHKYDTGSWAEATTGWPRSLSTSTTPALNNNDVIGVAAGVHDDWIYDPRTGGKMPCFGVSYGTGADSHSVIKYDGNVWDYATTAGNTGVAIMLGRIVGTNNDAGDTVLISPPITTLTADDWSGAMGPMASNNPPISFGADGKVAANGNTMVGAHTNGVTILQGLNATTKTPTSADIISATINRTYNSGYTCGSIKGAWLANSATADRSFKANTLTENGTVTSASADGASGELLAYSGFSDTTNYLYRATDTDYNAIGTGDFSQMIWFKTSGNTGDELLITLSGASYHVGIHLLTSGVMRYRWLTSAGNVSLDGTQTYDDGDWHMAVLLRNSSAIQMYIDGVLEMENTGGTVGGSITDAAMKLGIGCDGYDYTNAADTCSLTLARLSTTAPSAAQVRAIYEAEKGMFETAAKVLLQSGTTDAVLDVDVDPNGKVAVTQTDSMTIWDGLVATTQATLGANTAFEHLKSWNDTLIEVGATDLSISRPAEVIRTVFDEVKVLQEEFAGVDLSKLAAWVYFNGDSSFQIYSSYNIKSVSQNSTGRYQVTFAVPFKSNATEGGNYAVTFGMSANDNADTPKWVEANSDRTTIEVVIHDGTAFGDADGVCVMICGELEGQ